MKEEEFIHIDQDRLWKDIIEELVEDFVAFFLPELEQVVDFSRKPEFLEKELQRLFPANDRKGRRFNDKLIKLYLKDGTNRWVFSHVEVESGHQADFSERMFVYYYRIYDKHGKKITAIAIFTGERLPPSLGYYEEHFCGTKLTYTYNTFTVMDQQEEALLKSENPFALAILAAMYMQKSKNNLRTRKAFKTKLYRLLLERNYSRRKIISLVIFVQYILAMPEALEKELINELTPINQKKMSSLKLRAQDKPLVDLFIELYYGKKWEVLEKEQEEAAAKIEQEAAKIQKEAAKIQKEAAKIQKEAAEIQKEKSEVQKEKALLQQKRDSFVINLYTKGKIPIAQVAQFTEMEESMVTDILKRHGLMD